MDGRPLDRLQAAGVYLFAFLGSRYGHAFIRKQIYGGNIKHIEPEHVAGLPVPRLRAGVEARVHDLVVRAAELRSSSSALLAQVVSRFEYLLAGLEAEKGHPRIAIVPSSEIQPRFDAQFHDPTVRNVRDRLRENRHTTVGDLCTTIHLPGIFKRIHIEDERYGAPYYTGASLYALDPIPKGILSRRTKLFEQVELERNTVLVQAFGQDGGITGRPVWVGEHLHRATTTHMLCRLRADDPVLTAYLFGFLSSDAAYQQVRVLTYGGSIPHFDERGIATVVVPWLGDDAEVRQIGETVLRVHHSRDQALCAERQARALVERAIEEAT
jgi:type I restriction enzyme S subunit